MNLITLEMRTAIAVGMIAGIVALVTRLKARSAFMLSMSTLSLYCQSTLAGATSLISSFVAMHVDNQWIASSLMALSFIALFVNSTPLLAVSIVGSILSIWNNNSPYTASIATIFTILSIFVRSRSIIALLTIITLFCFYGESSMVLLYIIGITSFCMLATDWLFILFVSAVIAFVLFKQFIPDKYNPLSSLLKSSMSSDPSKRLSELRTKLNDRLAKAEEEELELLEKFSTITEEDKLKKQIKREEENRQEKIVEKQSDQLLNNANNKVAITT
ncbi:hypothetical protein SNEBB_011394 [Seison nebaliae]|nr:hypothetical protein SNEBB_011394 [Seison nebaliae]